jgi:hypothetical protein
MYTSNLFFEVCKKAQIRVKKARMRAKHAWNSKCAAVFNKARICAKNHKTGQKTQMHQKSTQPGKNMDASKNLKKP